MHLLSSRCIYFIYSEYVQLWVLYGSYGGIFGGGIAPLPQQEQVAQSRIISEIAAFGLTKNQIEKRLDCLSIPVRVTISLSRKVACRTTLRVLYFSDFGRYHLFATYFWAASGKG